MILRERAQPKADSTLCYINIFFRFRLIRSIPNMDEVVWVRESNWLTRLLSESFPP